MLFLPAAALCCLCSALVAMAAQLIQDDLTLTRRVDGDVSFSCRGTDQCDSSSVYWYQKKDTETFTRILRMNKNTCNIAQRFNHTQIDDFSAVYTENSCELKIQNITLLHSATYYCACMKFVRSYYMIFGYGTKLFVTDEQVVKPVVSVYPAASRAHLEGRSSLLCVASAMFPPLVRFSWIRRKEDQEQWLPAEGEQLELRESGRTAAILLVDRDDRHTYKYRCSVQHEGGTVEAQTEQGNEGLVTVFSSDSVPAAFPPSAPPVPSGPSLHRVKLLCVLYTVLIVKSLVYCCGLSLLRIL
ncbi:immunoglobulin lambda-1 light chain-like [Sparus aurata]|uniref:immunoglobulin lambda-1 light chain-like n=1 Tax=Sparus aurata TaxID=8175 RepID=UPI0011C0DCFE|nr:immunoglobulin lambda-1 light chain-like [Sparus aurata]